ADRRERIIGARPDVRRPAHHLLHLARPRVHLAEREPVRVRVRADALDPGDHNVGQPFPHGLDGVDRRAVHGQPVGELLGGTFQAGGQLLQPVETHIHGRQSNCERNRTSDSYSSRMSGIRYRSMAIRAGPMPNAKPVYRSASYPTCSNTAGSTIPAPMISIQPVPLHALQPPPPQIKQLTSASALGSVNGKKDGRKRTRAPGPKNSRANAATVALRSTKLIPSSTTRPSICSKAGACEASNGSRRYAIPGTTTRIGGRNACMVRICTGDVWRLSRMPSPR